MKKFLVFVFLILFVTIQCNDDGWYQESLDNMTKMNIWTFIIESRKPPQKFCGNVIDAQTKDNYDGTISLDITQKGLNFSGTCIYFRQYKKCLQGQVYRKAENDCKGKGSVSDYYGAQLFTGIPSAVESNTCTNLNEFNSRNWRIASFGSSTFEELIDLLMKEHDYIDNLCLLYESYWNNEVKCTLLPDNKLITVDKDKYRLYANCFRFTKEEYRDDKGNLL